LENKKEIIEELKRIKKDYDNIHEIITTDKKYANDQETIREYDIMLINELEKVCGEGIENCDTKINNGSYDEFSKYKLRNIIEVYVEFYGYAKNIYEKPD
jgi:soluble P-type ATPase